MKNKKAKKQIHKNRHILLGLTFGTVMIILVLLNILSGINEFSEQENRILSKKPHLNIENLTSGRFTKEYESFVNDQFPFRNSWIGFKTTMDRLEGKRESNDVYFGKDGYLLEKFKNPAEKKNNETVKAIIRFARKNRKLKTHALIVPTACNILNDKLPGGAPIDNQNEYMDSIFRKLSNRGIISVDVRDTFIKHKNDTQLYYHSDQHWTSEGAYLAFLKTARIMKFKASLTNDTPSTIKNDFDGMLASKSGYHNAGDDKISVYFPTKKTPSSIVTYVDTQEKNCSFYKTENLKKKDAYTVFTGGNHSIIKIKSATKRTGHLLIIKDSYANCYIPFIAPYFREVYVVDPRYYFGNLQKLIKSNDITEVLLLYNANTLSEDGALKAMLSD